MPYVKEFIGVICCITVFTAVSRAQIKEPYRPLHNGSYSGSPVVASPDPLITYRWDDPKTSDSLEIYTLSPKKIICTPQNSFKQTKTGITVLGTGDLFFDFGVESAGWLEFESDDLKDSIEASISEYNEPAIVNAGAQHRFKTNVPVKYGHTYRLELNSQLYEGVRFAWIHVKTFSKVWHIKNVRLVCQIRPTNYRGSFSCNDSLLTRIWYTGAYTVKLNLLQHYFGAILMERSDRHSWTGDAYPAEAAALAAFGNYGMIKKNLVFTSNQNNGIAAYSLYWVLSLIDFYNYTGDAAFLRKYTGNADRRLEKAYKGFDHLPPLHFMGWDERLGAGFENPQIQEAQNTYRMLCVDAWRQFAEAMSSIGNSRLAKKYLQFATIKTKVIEGDENRIKHFGIHAVSEAIDAGLGGNPQIKRLSKVLFADRLNRLSYSPFNQYFIIQAMAKAKQFNDALSIIKDCWGGQIKYGGTTFFEVYRPSWNTILEPNDPPPNNQCGYTSLCHPWSAGVTQWISENILGIKPVTPGFKSFTVIPHLNRKLTQLKGTMPTPYGSITADFNTRTGSCSVGVPDGTTAEKIGLPKAGRQILKVMVNGKMLKSETFHQVAGIGGVKEDSDYLYILNVKPGEYHFDITYNGVNELPKVRTEEFDYLITSFIQDSLTSGDWKQNYGKEGFMLFGYPKDMISRKMPAYIDTIILKKNKTTVWNSVLPDPSILSSPDSPKKIAAAIVTNDPNATDQTMTIDIKLKKNHPYRLSLYFLDGGKKDRRSAIEIFDLKTLDILAPVEMVEHYTHGKYVCFSFNKSIRVRIDQVRGKNAAVSGIFFDAP